MKTYADALDDQIRAANIVRGREQLLRDGRLTGVDISVPILNADSYFVSADFGRLVSGAAAALPPETRLSEQDFLTPTGWVSLAEPLDWSSVESQSVYPSGPGAAEYLAVQAGVLARHLVNGFYYEAHSGLVAITPFSDTYPLPISGFYGRADSTIGSGVHVGWIKAFALLTSQQSVSETEECAPPRAARKRAERAHVAPLIRVIRLPRRVRERASAEHKTVDWQNRWIVSGHWRNQPWGPERKRVRPIWIAPYVKGPDSAPLKPAAHRLFVATTAGMDT